MDVGEFMTHEARLTDPDETIREAARAMAKFDAGALQVAKNDRLVGMMTDRDIAIRASGKGPESKIRGVMSGEAKYRFNDQPVEEILEHMAKLSLRRLPVVDRNISSAPAASTAHPFSGACTLPVETPQGGIGSNG